jgi:hypothetical protein
VVKVPFTTPCSPEGERPASVTAAARLPLVVGGEKPLLHHPPL